MLVFEHAFETRRVALMRPPAQYEEVACLLGRGMNDCQIARLTGIPRGTVRDWRRKGRPRGNGPLGPDCPRCDGATLPDVPYAYLLGVYLGDGCISPAPKGVFKLRIVQDIRYPGIIEEIALALVSVRPAKRMKVGRVPRTGCVELNAHWKHWPCLFPQHGPGRKHERRIQFAPWQEEIARLHPGMLLRGLVHSDGYRGLNWVNGKGYPRYLFTNVSSDIRDIFCRACDSYGVSWRQSKWNTISVARAPDVTRLDLAVGPKT